MTYQVFLKDSKQPSFLNIEDLQKQLQFTYLDHLEIQCAEEKEKILQDGWRHEKEKKISDERIHHGIQFKQQIESCLTAKVSVRWISEDVGHGLFAEEDLKENSYIGEYVGFIRKNNEHGQFNHYLFSYPVLDNIERNYVIDAFCGNLIRFANHSFQPNAKATYAYFSGLYHLILLTLKPILKGEQITYNYGKNYWYLRGTPTTL